MDEPLSNLDAKLRVQMRTEIGKIHKKLQTTFIYVTHDQTEAMTMGTRIVVMKDGIIQQVDSPSNLYQYPCNMFVAGFIGSPQMNFLNVTVDCASNGTYLKCGDFSIKLPEGKGGRSEIKQYNGKEVIMGIRPEDIYDDPAFISSVPDCCSKVNIELVEMMGAETYLYLVCAGVGGAAGLCCYGHQEQPGPLCGDLRRRGSSGTGEAECRTADGGRRGL